ncbi:MAG: MBOAT family protein, partial [Lachnospiraceae bacterium]|nr:MBOAT family protein [Lachnospiraceae bacterium]
MLFLGSMVFYAWGEPKYTVLILCSIVVNYYFAASIERFNPVFRLTERRIILFLAVFYNVGMLFIFKYLSFLISIINSVSGADIPEPVIPLPLGISFYTFQIL